MLSRRSRHQRPSTETRMRHPAPILSMKEEGVLMRRRIIAVTLMVMAFMAGAAPAFATFVSVR